MGTSKVPAMKVIVLGFILPFMLPSIARTNTNAEPAKITPFTYSLLDQQLLHANKINFIAICVFSGGTKE